MDLVTRINESDLVDLPDWQVAEILNKPDLSLPVITSWAKTNTGLDGILEALGPTEGASFLEGLESLKDTNVQIKWALKIIERGVLDLSLQSVRTQLLAIAQPPFSLLTIEQVNKLLGLSKQERYPSFAEYYQIEVTARTVGLARGAI